jgi:hypothetical protein
MGLAASPYLCSLPADLPALWRIADDYRVVTDAGPIQRIRRFAFLLPPGCPGHTVPGVPVRQEKGPPDLFLIPAHPQTPGEPTQRCRCRSGMDAAGQYRDVCPPPQPVVPARAPLHGKADLDQRSAYDSTLAPPAPDHEFDQTVSGTFLFLSAGSWAWAGAGSLTRWAQDDSHNRRPSAPRRAGRFPQSDTSTCSGSQTAAQKHWNAESG